MNIEVDSAKSVNTKFTLTSNNAMSQLVYCFTEVAQNQISGPWIDWLVPLVTFSINPCTPKILSRICRFFSRHVLMYWWGQWGTLFREGTSCFVVMVYQRGSTSEPIRHRVQVFFVVLGMSRLSVHSTTTTSHLLSGQKYFEIKWSTVNGSKNLLTCRTYT